MHERHALYPGTFDPVTLGHLDILERALLLFDRITVAVAAHGHASLFSLEERVELFRKAAPSQPGCRVVAFSGLLVDEMRRQEAGIVIRGIRSVSDLENESAQVGMNRTLYAGCEYVFLLARPELAHISSTLVRDVVRLRGDITAFVDPATALAIQERAERG